VELIHQSDEIFTRPGSVSSLDVQKMIEAVRRKTHWRYSYVSLAESPEGRLFGHWAICARGLGGARRRHGLRRRPQHPTCRTRRCVWWSRAGPASKRWRNRCAARSRIGGSA